MTTAIDGMCKASDLRFLVSTKQFTVIPSHLLRYLQMEAGISLDEFGMWVAIYDLVAADPELQRPIAWKFLATRFGFSEKTAKRTCKRLVDKRLLVIESRHREDGSQLPSLFKIRVAKKVAERLLTETPDRAQPIQSSGDEQSGRDVKPVELPSPQNEKPAVTEIPEPEKAKTQPALKPDSRSDGRVNVRELMRNISAGMKQNEPSPSRADGVCASGDVSESAVNASAGPVNASESSVKLGQRESNSVNGQILLLGSGMKNCDLADRLEGIRKRSDFAQVKRSDEKRPDVAGQPKNVSKRVLEAGEKVAKAGVDRLGRGEGVKTGHQEKTSFEEKTNNNGLTKMIARKLTGLGLGLERVLALTCEVQASIERGSLKKFSLSHAMNIAAKLIREGKWTAPRLAYR